MSEIAREVSQEFWRPAQPPRQDFASFTEPQCSTCGTQFAPGARFCHVCGVTREAEFQDSRISKFTDLLDFTSVRARLGLSATSLVFAIAAAGCIFAALLVGFIYSATTLTEWQAVQTWRTEWMIAALVCLVAALLFKTSPEAKQ